MSYQVIARKWRPQKFDDVVGQQAVTRTLRNALASGRLAQAFVFAGPRGVGKTTTARILARALNCENGPTRGSVRRLRRVRRDRRRPRHGRARDRRRHAHQVDNVREVIIAGLGIMPVRNRYKVFIIDEVHQLSTPSFNALLKSIEEPPPHVVFMMATTELDKIPETVLSRSQVYEFRTIGTQGDRRPAARDRRRRRHRRSRDDVAAADRARRRRQHARRAEQARSGDRVHRQRPSAADDVATVLGLVGRDLLLDALRRSPTRMRRRRSRSPARAVEMGYDLRLVCRELSRDGARPAGAVGRSVARQRSGDRGRRRARSADRARRSVSRAKICCARSIC